MDPNEALARYRRAISAAEDAADPDRLDPESMALWVAVEAADDLFDWLSRGGFPPDDWARPDDDGKPRFPLTGLEG